MSLKLPAGGRPSAWRNVSAFRLALGFAAGAVTGPLLGSSSNALQPVADLFIGALEAAGPPVAAFALLSSLVAFSSRNLTRFASMSIAWFMGTAMLAAAIGTLSATALSVGAGYELVAEPVAKGAAAPDSADWFERLSAIVRGPTAHIAFWSLFAILIFRRQLGASSRADGGWTGLLKHCVDVAFLILSWIMLFAPIGVFALAAITFSRLQLTAAVELLRVFVAIYAGQAILCFAAAVTLVALTRSRGAFFFRGISGALLTAFATGSSAAAAPVEIAAANERVGIDREVAGLVIPLGLAVSKIGTAVFIAVVLVFAAAVGPQGLTLSDLVVLTLLAFAASVITPPISGGALVVLSLLGSDAFLPISAIVIAATIPLAGKLNTPINSLGRLISARVLSDRQPATFAQAGTSKS